MKASIDADGVLSVEAENPLEEYALKKWKDDYDKGETILRAQYEVGDYLWTPWNADYCIPAGTDLDTYVEVRYRNGETDKDEVRSYDWSRTDDPQDIIAYRLA